MASLRVTRFHVVSLGFTFVSLGFTRTRCYVTWCHSVSLGVTRCHSVSLGYAFVPLGVTWFHSVKLSSHSVSLGVTRLHQNQVVVESQVRSRMTWFHLGVLRRSDGVFFSFGEKKRLLGVTWIHFFAKKQVFQEVAG